MNLCKRFSWGNKLTKVLNNTVLNIFLVSIYTLGHYHVVSWDLLHLEPDSEQHVAHFAGLEDLVRNRQDEANIPDFLSPHFVVRDAPCEPKQ